MISSLKLSKPILAIHGGMSARIQLLAIIFLGILLRIFYRGSAESLMERGGYYRLLMYLGGPLYRRRNSAMMALPNGALIEIQMSDPYWARLLYRPVEYEPEIAHVLRLTLGQCDLFIDCGANIGFWSIWSSAESPGTKILAIEASPATFELLKKNCRLNRWSFKCIQQAVLSDKRSDIPFVRSPVGHACAHVHGALLGTADSTQPNEVIEKTDADSLDSIVEKHIDLTGSPQVILKLDVEGVEIDALKGAEQLLQSQPLLIYEDHGLDSSNAVSWYVMSQLEYMVFALDRNNRLAKLRNLDDISKIKELSGKGYNFFACAESSPFAPLLRDQVAT